MDARTALHGARWPAVDLPVWSRLARAVATSLLALLAIAAVVICARRAAGALTEPLAAPVLCALGAALAVAAMAFRQVVAPRLSAVPRIARYALWAAPSTVLALWVVGLSLHETTSGGLIGLVGLLVVEEGWSWGRFARVAGWRDSAGRDGGEESPGRAGGFARGGGGEYAEESPGRAGDFARGGGGEYAEESVGRAGGFDESRDAPDAEGDHDISQRLVRRHQDEGGERIEGWVRAEFATSQRLATAHLAICPPFARVPECFAEPSDGPASQVKVAQVLPYGVRLEIKLDEAAAEPSQVTVEFVIAERTDDE